MPAIIISTNEDGSVTLAPIDATPEMLQAGEQFASMDEAMQAVGEVMGEAPGGDQAGAGGQGGDGNLAPNPDEGAEPAGLPPDDSEAPTEDDEQMGAGYKRARRGQ
jgi:hypothetical protein